MLILSICLPTYNRANQLDRQLGWVAQEIVGFEHECEIIVSDNCSTDHTQNIVEKWRSYFSSVTFQANRNAENIGWIKNFSYCLHTAIAPHTWIVGDDDLIRSGTLAKIIQTLKEKPDLPLLYLNYSGRNIKTGAIIGAHWFDPTLANSRLSGKEIFQHCIAENFGSVIFITAIVFHTQLAQTAIQKWPSSLDSWAGVATWTGYCAAQGNILVTAENYIECIIGNSHWQKESRIHFKTRYHDTPEVYLHLREMGYSPSFCKQMLLTILKEDFTSIRFIRSFIGSLLVKPLWAIQVVSYFIASLFSTSATINIL
jgi:glycosyltransferase involved in cell wall biosynthesis